MFDRCRAAVRGLSLLWVLCGGAPVSASERGAPLVQVYDLQETVGSAGLATELLPLPDGRLFIAALGGPVIHDGVRWQVLNHPRRLGGFSEMTRTPDGRIYAGFNGDLGYWLEDVRGRWSWHSVLDQLPASARQTDAMRGIASQDDGRILWFLTQSRLIRMPVGGEVSVLDAEQPFTGGWLVGADFWVQDASGRLARAPATGALTLEAVPGAAEALGTDANGRGYFVRHIVHSGAEWRLLLTDARILRYREGQFSDWPHAAVDILRRQRVLSFAELHNGHWVIGSTGHGPVVLDADGQLLDQYDASDGVPVRATYGLYEDHQGGVWLAQERSLVRIDLASGLTQLGEAQGLPVGAETLRRINGVLYAIGGNYLYRLRPGDGSAAARFERVDGEVLRSVLDVAPAADGLLVVSAGLHRHRDGVTQEILPLATTTSVSASTAVPGRYWLGHQKGLQRVDIDPAGQPMATPMPVPWPVWQTVETDAQTLWLADRAGHLARMTLSDPPQLREYHEADGLPGGTVKIYPRRAGGVWLATLSGVMVHDPQSDRLRKAAGLPPEMLGGRVFALLEDIEGNLWARGDDLNAVAWRRGDQYVLDQTLLHGVSTRPTSYAFLREGAIVWVARSNGLLRIDLNARQAPPPARPPYLSEIRTGPELVRVGPTDLRDLPFEQRDLQLRFGAADLHRSEALVFRSQLHGYDADYSPWSGLAERSYTNLPSGDYQFELQVQDGYGRSSSAPPLAIRIAPPWYRSPLAYAGWLALAVLLLWAAAALGARRRQRGLLQRQRALEQEVRLRTQEIAGQNETLRTQAEALATQARQLAEVDQLKTRFFVHVGHEFRTPLTLVMGPLDDVLRDPGMRLHARARDLLELAQRNARRVLDLVVEMLDVHKLEHGQLPLQRVPVDLAGWLPRQLAEQQALIERHGHQLAVEIAPGPLVASIDALQLARVVGNLLSNAAKYMRRGGEIRVCLDRDGEHARLRVSDAGRGISATALPHVFDRFYRADEGDGGGGHGVGLALVREIVERHGGRIRAESTLGVGTCFEVQLALVADTPVPLPAPLDPAAAEPAPAAAPGEARGRPRVLVVDDHADLRLRLRQLMATQYEVIEAEDGPGALQAACSQLPDVVVADVMMPGFDGVELARRLRADPETAAIGILLLTAKAGAEHAVVGLQAGADDYLAKPFDAGELLARVEALLAQMRRLQARLSRQGQQALPSAPVIDRQEARWRERLDQIIDAQLSDPEFNVEALAQAMHLDRSALFRRLKQMGELAPADLLRERRLLRAQDLLRRGDGSVTEIAFAVGFDNLSSFTRAFRTRFACAPSSLLPGVRQAAR